MEFYETLAFPIGKAFSFPPIKTPKKYSFITLTPQTNKRGFYMKLALLMGVGLAFAEVAPTQLGSLERESWNGTIIIVT